MPAEKGNKYYLLRKKKGRNKLFATPRLLQEAAEEYFQWVDDNPLYEKQFINQGRNGIAEVKVPKMRPYTLSGLCIFVGISTQTLYNYKKYKGFKAIVQKIKDIIFVQKFEGALCGLFNPTIIARDLNLKDRVIVKNNFGISRLWKVKLQETPNLL